MLLHEMAGVFPHPGPDGYHGGEKTGVRNSDALRSVPRVAQGPGDEFWIQVGGGGMSVIWYPQNKDGAVPP